MNNQQKRTFFELAKNCIVPLIKKTKNQRELIELHQIKTVIDKYKSYMYFVASCDKAQENSFFNLVNQYESKLIHSFQL